MGEAKKKATRLESMLKNQPNCIYCGDLHPAESVDHFPPRIMFFRKHRPKGLEVPACHACNAGTSLDEQVAAFFSRAMILSDSPEAKDKATYNREVQSIMTGLFNNAPELMLEIYPSPDQKIEFKKYNNINKQFGGPINAGGPILNRYMNRFAAKMGFALYFNKTGKAIQRTGRVVTFWQTNKSAIDGKIPEGLLKLFPHPDTLRQGKQNVESQFLYSSVILPDGSWSVHRASFRFSFSIIAFVTSNHEKFPFPSKPDEKNTFPPGSFRHPPETGL